MADVASETDWLSQRDRAALARAERLAETPAPEVRRPLFADTPESRRAARNAEVDREGHYEGDAVLDRGVAVRTTGTPAVVEPQRREISGARIRTELKHIAKRFGVENPVFPGIGPLKRLYAVLEGGRDRYLEFIGYAVADGNQTARKWLEAFQMLSDDAQDAVVIENVCVACGVSVSELTGIVVQTAMKHGHDAAEITANTMLPGVVRQLGKSAVRIGGVYADIAHKDRTLLLQSRKFVTVNKGPVVNVNANASANAKSAAAAASAPSVPSFLEDMRTAVETKEAIQGELAPHIEAEED